MHDDSDWRKVDIVRSLPYLSYELKTEDGLIYRCTLKHVRFSAESPLIVNDGSDDSNVTLPPPSPEPQTQSQKIATAQVSYATRLGRQIIKPACYMN